MEEQRQRKEALARRREQDQTKQKKELDKKYKERGIQKITLSEYEAARRKSALKRKDFKLPLPLQLVLGAPFLVIFCFGIIFLPYIFYLIITSPSADTQYTEKKIPTSQSAQKQNSQITPNE